MIARYRQQLVSAVALTAVFTLTGSTRASVVTYASSYSITNGSTFTSLTPPNGGFSGSPPHLLAVGEGVHTTVSLPQFDPALGTLTVVTFTLSATQQAGMGELQVVFGVSPGSMVFMLDEVRAFGPTGRLVTVGSSRTVSAPPPGFYPFSILTPSPDVSAVYNDPATLAAYLGTGTFSIDLFKHLETAGLPGSFIHTRLTSPGTAAGTLTVTYEFTPVPAPPGWALLGIGIVFAFISRATGLSAGSGLT